MPRRPRGTGRLYQPKGSSIWWIKYYLNGVPQRESTGTPERRKAENFLKKRLGECVSGNFLGADVERVTVAEIMADKLAQSKNDGDKSTTHKERMWKLHLEPMFSRLRCSQVTTDSLRKYIAQRKTETIGKIVAKTPSNATINRELKLLCSAFHLGMKSTPPKVNRIPHFPIMEEAAPRKGYLKDEQYFKLCGETTKIGLWLRATFEVAVTYGWRRGEVTEHLQVRQIDLAKRTIDLDPGTTKNDDARIVRMTQQVYELLSLCIHGKSPDDLVFTREHGKPIGDFRKTWASCCKAAGVEGLLFHDLRRTGARNMRRLGIAEGTIMKIGGWKTRSVFDRYNIVDQSDLADAARRMEERYAQLVKEQAAQEQEVAKEPDAVQNGHSLGIVNKKRSKVVSTQLPN
jgi:integrase